MRRLVVDTDALVHGRALGLKPLLEMVMRALPEKSLVERGVYMEMHQRGVGTDIEEWLRSGVVESPIDYRSLPGGDQLFRETPRKYALSREDRASLVLAKLKRPTGILTCEGQLNALARDWGVLPVDLFDALRLGLQFSLVSDTRARTLAEPWKDKRAPGRPRDYRGTFDAEMAYRTTARPLPFPCGP